jgi:formate/nitrite transporter FocA (FNT family)
MILVNNTLGLYIIQDIDYQTKQLSSMSNLIYFYNTATQTFSDNSNSNNLIYIIIGCIVVGIVLIVLLYFLFRRNTKKDNTQPLLDHENTNQRWP